MDVGVIFAANAGPLASAEVAVDGALHNQALLTIEKEDGGHQAGGVHG